MYPRTLLIILHYNTFSSTEIKKGKEKKKVNSWYFLLQFSLIFGLFFNLRKKKIKNGFTTFFLYTFLHSFLLLFCSEFTFPFLLSFSLVRFLASDLRNPFNLRNTLLSPFFSPLTFSSLLCASLLRYLSSSHPLDSRRCPSTELSLPVTLRLSSLTRTLLPPP